MLRGEVQGTSKAGKWARYVDRETTVKPLHLCEAVECLPNRLTLFDSEIHYKEENYLEVRTASLKYITPPHSKGFSTSVRTLVEYVAFPRSERPARSEFHHVTRLPLVPWFHWF